MCSSILIFYVYNLFRHGNRLVVKATVMLISDLQLLLLSLLYLLVLKFSRILFYWYVECPLIFNILTERLISRSAEFFSFQQFEQPCSWKSSGKLIFLNFSVAWKKHNLFLVCIFNEISGNFCSWSCDIFMANIYCFSWFLCLSLCNEVAFILLMPIQTQGSYWSGRC